MEQIVSQLIKSFEKCHEIVKVSDLLLKLDLSLLSKKIEHKHPKFAIESYLRLYLYKRIKGYLRYKELLSISDYDKEKLGFLDLPKKRTFNEFIQKKIDTIELDKIAELILKKATQKKILLDIELVKKEIKKKKSDFRQKQKALKEATKLVKRLIYPQIDLKIKQNGKFTTRDLLDVLVHVAQNNSFCNNGSKTFQELNPDRKVPHGDTLMYHFRKMESLDEIKKVFERIFDVIFKFAKKEYLIINKRKIDIAIDIHKIPYYGNKGDNYVVGGQHERGTSHFFEYITCVIVMAGRRFTIDALPIHQFDNLHELVDRIIKRAKTKIRIDKVYLDRGFDRIKVINVLKINRVKFLMPKIKSKTVKEWFDKSEDCQSRLIRNFKIGKNEKAYVNLYLIDDEEGIKRAFITNFYLPVQLSTKLFLWYSRRWGIETGYRVMDKDFKPRTTSKNYNIRLFYFLFTVCLYNLWVLINICISITMYGKILDKPIITAKMFAIVLFKVQIDPGG